MGGRLTEKVEVVYKIASKSKVKKTNYYPENDCAMSGSEDVGSGRSYWVRTGEPGRKMEGR